MLRIVLISPFNHKDNIFPLSLGYLSTSLKSHDCKIYDFAIEGSSKSNLKNFLIQFKPHIVGITYWSNKGYIVEPLCEFIKQIDKKIKVILGGPHPSSCPEEILKRNKNVDHVFLGESEIAIKKYVEKIERNDNSFEAIKGIAFRKNSAIIKTGFHFEENLDQFGPINWEEININEYLKRRQFLLNKYKAIPIITTRGCPYLCKFCNVRNINGTKIRCHSVNYILSEIDRLYNKYGVREFKIVDDNFTFNKEYVIDFCKAIIKKKYPKIAFSCPNGVRIDALDDEVLSLMKKAGWYSLYLGIESGSDKTLKRMNKKLAFQTIEKQVKLIKKYGFIITGFFIIGYPDETHSDIMKTIQFAKRLNIDLANFHTFVPFPGTPIYEELVEKCEINKNKFSEQPFLQPVYAPRGMNIRELRHLFVYALFSFYLRPRTIKTIFLLFIKRILSIKRVFLYMKNILKKSSEIKT